MKTMRKAFSLLLALLTVLALGANALAADGPTYTVRIFAGAQGTIPGGSEGGTVLVLNVKYGERVSFSPSQVTLKDGSKYYVMGIREAGKDNSAASASFIVSRDMDLVVAYGLLSSAVAYTVQYTDPNGAILSPTETFYGNAGDKPVVAYRYINNYQPRYYNLTQTLSTDASKNVFRFIYDPLVTVTPTPVPRVPYNPYPNQNANTNQNTNPGQNAPRNPNTAAPTATPAPGANAGNGILTPAPTAAPTQPEEILDLDVPLAEPEAETPASASASASASAKERLHRILIAGLATFAVVAFALAIWLLITASRRDGGDDE